jgi:hypothetical protein
LRSVANKYTTNEFTGSSISPFIMYLPATPILLVDLYVGEFVEPITIFCK